MVVFLYMSDEKASMYIRYMDAFLYYDILVILYDLLMDKKYKSWYN